MDETTAKRCEHQNEHSPYRIELGFSYLHISADF